MWSCPMSHINYYICPMSITTIVSLISWQLHHNTLVTTIEIFLFIYISSIGDDDSECVILSSFLSWSHCGVTVSRWRHVNVVMPDTKCCIIHSLQLKLFSAETHTDGMEIFPTEENMTIVNYCIIEHKTLISTSH